MDNAVIPECYVDTNLIETLVPPAKRNNQQGYNHQKGCGGVAQTMKKQFADRFALGIIDKDKQQVDYLEEFEVMPTEKCSLILHRHKEKNKHHYIIQIYPAIEKFIFENAKSAGISVTMFGLPEDFNLFKKETKTGNSKHDHRFKSLFKALHDAGAADILRLASWVKYLKETNYQANMDTLK